MHCGDDRDTKQTAAQQRQTACKGTTHIVNRLPIQDVPGTLWLCIGTVRHVFGKVGDAIPQIVIGPCHGFLAPLVGDFVVRHLDVPIGLVGKALHDQHHGHFAHGQHLRVGAIAIGVDAYGVEEAALTLHLTVPSQIQVPAGVPGFGILGHLGDFERLRLQDGMARWLSLSAALG